MRRGLLLVALVSLVTSCATEADGLPFTAPAGQSLTPRITTPDEQPPDLVMRLLTRSDVADLTGFADAIAGELEDVAFFENPDPRGPCGAEVPATSLDGVVGRTFAATDGALVELVGELDEQRRAEFDAYLADAEPGCGPWESMTNAGTTQRVSDISFVDLDGIGDVALGATMRIENNGVTFAVAGIQLIAAEHFAVAQMYGERVPRDDELVALAQRMADRLAAGERP